jgi:hypothetical protein
MCVFEHDLRGEGHLPIVSMAEGVASGVPLCVQRKARDAGVAIGENEWRALPRAAQSRLTGMLVRDDFERRNYATLLAWLLRTFTAGPVRPSFVPDSPPALHPWHRAPTDEMESLLAANGLDWFALSPDARFALHLAGSANVERVVQRLRESPAECIGAPCVLT